MLFQRNVDGSLRRLGETETIHDSPNPQFVKTVVTEYHFESQDLLIVHVYDRDDESESAASAAAQEGAAEQDLSKH